jgi:Aerotolerance regulator N-terminal
MIFINPLILWAMAAVSIPLAIHFFNFQKLKKISFTNVKWLEELKVASSKRKNLKHILILIARILVIIFLVFAFSQPVLPPHKGQLESGTWTRVFAIDNSFSMEVAGESGNGLNRSRKTVSEIVNKTPSLGEAFLFENSFLPKDDYPYDKASIEDRLAELDFSLKRRTIGEHIDRANSRGSIDRKKEVWIMSDFQKKSTGNLSLWQLDSMNEYFLMPLQPESRVNFFIDSLWLEKPFIEIGNSFVFKGILRGSGDTEGSEINIRLLVEGEQRASKTVIFEDQNQIQFSFEISLENAGFFKCVLELDDPDVSIDNQFRFVLSPLGGIKISELGSGPNPFLSALFGSEPAFDHSFVSFQNPDLSRLRNSELIIVEDGEGLGDYEPLLFKSFVEGGGHIFVLPGPDSLSPFLNPILGFSGIAVRKKPLQNERISLAPIDGSDPFFEGVFEKMDRRMDLPETDLSWDVSGWERVLLKQRNDKAFLVFSDRGQGRVYVSASPLDETHGNFVKHSLFVPVIFRIAAFSQGKEKSWLYQRFDREFLAVGIRNVNPGSIVTLRGKDISLIPEQRLVGKTLVMSIRDYQLQPGFYDLTVNDSVFGIVALNPSSSESDLEYYSPEELAGSFSEFQNVKVFENLSPDEISKSYSKDFVGRPLWKYCLIFALLFLVTETIFLRLL